MGELQSPHDLLFRYVFGKPEHAASLLRSMLPPAVAKAIDWRSLVRDDTVLVDRRLGRRPADSLFVARLRRTRALLRLLPEHMSTGKPFTVLKVLGYGVRVWERCRRDHPRSRELPCIIACVLHHGERPWRGPRHLRPLVDLDGLPVVLGRRRLANMTLVVKDLTTMRERRMRQGRLTGLHCLTELFLQRLRHVDDDQAAAALRRWRRTLVAVADSPTGQDDFEALFSYLHATTDLDLERLRAVLAEIHPKLEHAYMTTADRIRRKAIKEGIAKGVTKGRAKGRTEGRTEGRIEGQAAVVLRMLQRRFGPLPEAVVARIQTATDTDLDRYADLVLTAVTLDEVLRPEAS